MILQKKNNSKVRAIRAKEKVIPLNQTMNLKKLLKILKTKK